MRGALAGLACILGVALLQAEPRDAAQDRVVPQSPVFRAETGYVELTAIVTDRRGNFVPNLTRDDFELLEDGRPQRIEGFALVDVRTPVGAGPAGGKDDAGLPDTAAKTAGGRAYLIVLDHFHLAPSQAPRLRAALREFIERHLEPFDVASVVHLSLAPRASVFSSDKAMLLAFADVSGSGPEFPGNPAAAVERSFEGLGRTLEHFSALRPGRKAVLFFSHGVAIDPLGAAAGGSPAAREVADRANQAMRQLIARARRSDVIIYTIDPRGLTAVNPFVAVDVTRDNEWGSLRTIANETGGEAILHYNRFDVPFRRIVEDTSRYYQMGYYTAVSSRDTTFHRLTLRVRNRPLFVRTRAGFYGDAVKSSASAALDPPVKRVGDLLAHPFPTRNQGLPLTVSATPVGRTSAGVEVQLVVEMDGGALVTGPTGAALPGNRLELGYQTVDAMGRPTAEMVSHVDFRPTQGTWAAVAAHGWRYLSTFRLSPGFHQLRVAALEAGAGRFGSVVLDLPVVDVCRGDLGLGSVLLSSASGAARPTSGRASGLLASLAGPPVAGRQFERSDTVTAYVALCSGSAQNRDPIVVTTSLHRGDGQDLWRTTTTYEGGTRVDGMHGHAAVIPLAGLSAGDHLLTIEARLAAPDAVPFQRRVVLTVR